MTWIGTANTYVVIVKKLIEWQGEYTKDLKTAGEGERHGFGGTKKHTLIGRNLLVTAGVRKKT